MEQNKIKKNLLPITKNHLIITYIIRPKEGLPFNTRTNMQMGSRQPIVFDAVPLHATNKGLKDRQWNTQMGLLLTFLEKCNEKLAVFGCSWFHGVR